VTPKKLGGEEFTAVYPAASIQIYIWGDRGAEGGGVWGGGVPLPSGEGVWGKGKPLPRIFFDFGSQNSELRCILGAIFAVQLVALHAKSSAYERIEQKAAKQGYWKLYKVAFCVELNVTLLKKPNKHEKNSVTFVDSITVSVSSALILCIFSPPQSFTRFITYTQAKTLRGERYSRPGIFLLGGNCPPPRRPRDRRH